MRFRLSFHWLLLLFLFVVGCAQRESDVGSKALVGSPSDSFVVISGTPTKSTDWHPPFTNGGGSSLEVGDAKHLYSFIAIRFNVKTGLPDSVVADSMTVRLSRGKVWPNPDELPGLLVDIRQIPDSVSWRESSLIPGSLPGHDDYLVLMSLVASSTDSFLYISLPNAGDLWDRWRADTANVGGLLIQPRNYSDNGFIEFYSHQGATGVHPEYAPQMTIRGTARRSDSTWVQDTTLTTYATDDAYLVVDSTDASADSSLHRQRFLITQGMPQRGALYFPLDTVLTNLSRTVVRAELRIYPDTTDAGNRLAIRYAGEDMLMRHGFLLDSTWLSHPDSLQLNRLIGPESSTSGTWDSTNAFFRFDVTGLVSTWVNDPSRNEGMQILASDELDFLAREVFYGADADSVNQRPKLLIWYTETPY